MSSIEIGKRYRTRDGREVRIYAVDGGGVFPVHGAYRDPGHKWNPVTWTRSGSMHDDYVNHPIDLVEVKPKITRTVWLTHYRAGAVTGRSDREICVRDAKHFDVVAITGPHEITFTEGEGL